MRKKIPMSFAADLWDRTRITRLDSILASDPDDIDANYEKGTTLLELCRSNEALECFGNVLRQEPAHMGSWVGRGRALTMEEDYDGAKACFGKVPENDEVGKDAMHWSDINEWYRTRRRQRQTNTVETVAEKNFNDSLENWMKQHLSHIQNLKALLIKFMSDKYCHRRKPGNAFHAYLVKKFYEDSGPLKVVAVECNDIEPNTDVDIRLDGNICLQAWHGKTPLEYTLEENLVHGANEPTYLDWCEELKPVLKKLKQLPSNTGKGFVLNYAPGISGLVSPALHDLCSERKCVMEISLSNLHISIYGTVDFRYRNEACQIARVLGRPPVFLLGDWNEIQAQGRDPMAEATYGFDPSKLPYRDLLGMDKNGLLDYVKLELKDPQYNDLVNLHRDSLLEYVLRELIFRDSCYQDSKL